MWDKLIEIRNKRERQIREITDSFGDPIILARYYVEPKCQQHNPADFNEVEAISSVRCPVFDTMNDFLNREFLVNDGRHQMFVLADAGMGKTSLLVMLKLTKMTSFWPEKFHCELLPLGPDTLSRIESISDKRNTVLLLDALDEDTEGFGRVEERLVELLAATRNFRRVIISCRTQYFPSGGDDPFDRPGRIEVGGFVCPMIFLSLFDDDQVEEYLRKRFPKGARSKLVRSREVVEKMETLRFRPLLLAHIDDIIDSPEKNWNEYTVYRALVLKWLMREETKLRQMNRGPVGAKSLWAACTAIALHMHSKDSRFVTDAELTELIQSTPDVEHLEHFDVGGRSLLNRNSRGDYRFSHYTTQEFLIAHSIAHNETDGSERRIRATDQIIHFLSASSAMPLRVNWVDFTGCDLAKLSLSRAEAIGAIFAKANLGGRDLSWANLSGADLSGADLVGTNLRNAQLVNARLQGSNLFQAILDNADLSGSDLSGCRLEECSLDQTIIKATLDGAFLSGLKFREVDFSGTSLKGCNLSEQILTSVNFSNLDLSGADLSECDLSNSNLEGANLSHANLRNSNLSNANLTNAVLDDAILSSADLRAAELKGVNLKHVDLRTAIIKCPILQELIDSGASLKDWDLSSYDLRFADLSNVDLSWANLAGKDLYGATLYRTNLVGADLSNTNLGDANFVGAYYSLETRFPETFSPYNEGMIRR